MLTAFFEGPAGSGKTHCLIEETVGVCEQLLKPEGSKLLALTFMNGARRRLSERFRLVPALRNRFRCLTFDAFAMNLVMRRRSLLTSIPVPDAGVSQFDRWCSQAASLLQIDDVAQWIACSYPLIVVDESQDLDERRLTILQELSKHSTVIAAADGFQNLFEHIDDSRSLAWLKSANRPVNLTTIRRTSRDGLLQVGSCLRNGHSVLSVLEEKDKKKDWEAFTCFAGAGMRILEVPAKNTGTLSWAIANEISKMPKAVIITPDASSDKLLTVLSEVQTKKFPRNKAKGTTFGPYSFSWESRDDDEIAMISELFPKEELSLESAIQLASQISHPAKSAIVGALRKARAIRGATSVSVQELDRYIEQAVKNCSRWHDKPAYGRTAMTIFAAKNREFPQVVVLWPQTVGNNAEHQRRLLYNAITRAQQCCSVIVFGQGRLKKPPFSSSKKVNEAA